MPKPDLTQANLRQSYRGYTKANRQDWADMGFRNMTCLVHDDEREIILAEMEVRKYAAMVAMAENSKLDAQQLIVLSRRNMAQLPQAGEIAHMKAEADKSTAKMEVLGYLDIAQNFVKRFRGIEGQYPNADDAKKVRMAAKAVAYSGACTAHLRLAAATLEFAPRKDTSIFGLRGDDE